MPSNSFLFITSQNIVDFTIVGIMAGGGCWCCCCCYGCWWWRFVGIVDCWFLQVVAVVVAVMDVGIAGGMDVDVTGG
jgi:hypothetical protein